MSEHNAIHDIIDKAIKLTTEQDEATMEMVISINPINGLLDQDTLRDYEKNEIYRDA